MVDYYQVLGVKHTASTKEIKAAYKRLARLRHPDLNGGSAEAFVQISHARDILLDPKSRAEHDAQRHAAAPGPGAFSTPAIRSVKDWIYKLVTATQKCSGLHECAERTTA